MASPRGGRVRRPPPFPCTPRLPPRHSHLDDPRTARLCSTKGVGAGPCTAQGRQSMEKGTGSVASITVAPGQRPAATVPVLPFRRRSARLPAEKGDSAPWRQRFSRCQTNSRHGASPHFPPTLRSSTKSPNPQIPPMPSADRLTRAVRILPVRRSLQPADHPGDRDDRAAGGAHRRLGAVERLRGPEGQPLRRRSTGSCCRSAPRSSACCWPA